MDSYYERRVLYEPVTQSPIAEYVSLKIKAVNHLIYGCSIIAILGSESLPHLLPDDAEMSRVRLEDVLPSLHPTARIISFTCNASELLKHLDVEVLAESLLVNLMDERLRVV